MIGYVVGTVVVVFGGVALLILLVLSLNRGVSAQPQSQPTQQPPQGDSDRKKWVEYIGWVFFAYIVWDLFGKFVSPRVPVEWKEWLPSFSWDTFEILALVAGVAVLWNKMKEKEFGQCGGVKNGSGTGKVIFQKTSSAIKIFIAAGLGIFAYMMYEYQVAHVEDLVASVESGYLYIPIHGLLFAGAAMILSIILTDFSLVDILAWFSFHVFLVLGMWNHWFMPHFGDFVLPSWYILFGNIIAVSLLFLHMGDGYLRTQSTVNCILVSVAVWLPQLVLL